MSTYLHWINTIKFTTSKIRIVFQLPFLDELKAELRFILSFSGDTKPVRHRELSGSGSRSTKNDEEDKNCELESLDDGNKLDPAPTPRSERSTHSHHTIHSRRTSNAVQMAKMRKYSIRSGI